MLTCCLMFASTIALAADPPAAEPDNSAPAAAPEILSRKIVRDGIKTDGSLTPDFAKKTGWNSAVAIVYRVLLLDPRDGKPRPVNEDATQFQIGQQFLLELECDCDLYVWIYYFDSTGKPELLLPDPKRGEKNVMVKRKEKLKLPADGTCFKFTDPPGADRLLIFASTKPTLDIVPAEALKDNPTNADLKKIQMKLESTTKDIKTRGLNSWRQQKARETSGEATTVIAGTDKKDVKPDLRHEIVLRCGKTDK